MQLQGRRAWVDNDVILPAGRLIAFQVNVFKRKYGYSQPFEILVKLVLEYLLMKKCSMH